MSFYNRKEMGRVGDAMQTYFDTRNSEPHYLAADWAMRPHEIQEPFFDTCVAYIQEVAGMDDVYTSMMRINRDTARGMLGME